MDNVSELVIKRLKESFGKDIDLDVHDEKGDGKHFFVSIVSNRFEEKTLLQRNRMVYSILDDLIKQDVIHAIRMKLKTPQEI